MANITVFKNYFVHFIDLDQVYYYVLGPDDRLGSGAITVTVHTTEGVGGLAPRYAEVTQMATRREVGAGGKYQSSLDIVVRNNGHVGGGGTGFDQWIAYTSVINQ